MRGSSRLLFVAAALCALAFTAPAALAAKPKVEILSDGQGAILSKGSLKARVTVAVRRTSCAPVLKLAVALAATVAVVAEPTLRE